MSVAKAGGVLLLLASITLVGCRQQASPETATSRGATSLSPSLVTAAGVQDADPPASAESIVEAALERAALTEIQQESIDRILAAGGVIEYDQRGYPTLIDLASDRVFADDELILSALEFPRLSRLRLAVSKATPAVLAELGSMTGLEELMLQDAAVTDQDLSGILAAAAKLERLTLRRLSQVSDGIVEPLAKCSHLRVLGLIEMNGISGAALGGLPALEQLRVLDLRNCGGLMADDFKQLLKLDQLDELKLGGPAINNEVLRLIALHPRITSLAIEDAEVSGDCLSCLAASPDFATRLRGLSFARCFGLTDESLDLLPEFPQLESLVLRDILVTGTFLVALDARKAGPLPLRTLHVTKGFLSDATLEKLPQCCPHLTRLDVRGNVGVTDATMGILRELAELKEVRLEDTGVTDPGSWRSGR